MIFILLQRVRHFIEPTSDGQIDGLIHTASFKARQPVELDAMPDVPSRHAPNSYCKQALQHILLMKMHDEAWATSTNASATDVWVNEEAPQISGICAGIKELIGRSKGSWELAKR